MKKLRILILLIVPLLAFHSCTKEMPEPEVLAKFPVTEPITDQLTGFQNTAENLVNGAVVFAGSLDPIANTIGEWMAFAGTAMEPASYYLNIAKEAEVSDTPVGNPSASGEVTVYKYMIFTWSASGGEETKYVAYQLIAGEENTVHEVLLSDSEGGSYTKIMEATVENSDLENGTMTLSLSGNLGSPDYAYEWTQHGGENVSVKVTDNTGDKTMYAEILLNPDNTWSFAGKEDSKPVITATANAERLKGSYVTYDDSGNEENSGDWDLLREDLSTVTLSIIDLYTPLTAIRDSLGALAGTEAGANAAWMHFGGTIVPILGQYVALYSPPPDAVTSSEPIEGTRWSLVYYWDDLAYQVSTTPETYYHVVYKQNGEAWDTLCYAEDSKTMRSAEMYLVKDTLGFDYITHFKLSKAQDGVSDLLHLVQPTNEDPGWQDYILTFNPETLEASDWRQIFNNSFGPFNWRVGNWTAGCATGYWENWGWGPHEIKETLTWPSK